jgi:hypothetical protein
LIGERLNGGDTNIHGHGTYQLPGGHLEWGEHSFAACIAREVEEETGLITDVKRWTTYTVNNNVMAADGKHYVTVFMLYMYDDNSEFNRQQQPTAMEPTKCRSWKWYAGGGGGGDENDGVVTTTPITSATCQVPSTRFQPLQQLLDDSKYRLPGYKQQATPQ